MKQYKIDAENPILHELPEQCRYCGVIYYFGGHFCPIKDRTSMEKFFKQ